MTVFSGRSPAVSTATQAILRPSQCDVSSSLLSVPRGLLPARLRPRGVFNRFMGCRGEGGSPTPLQRGGTPPLGDPNLGGRRVGQSAGGLPRGGGRSVGTPTYIPQNDPHDAVIHKWGRNFFQKKFAHQLRLPSAKVRPGGRVGVKILFCVFHPFLNSPQNSEYFEFRHTGSNRKIFPCRMPKTKSPAPPAPTKPIVQYNHFGVCSPPPPPHWGRVLAGSSPRLRHLVYMADADVWWGCTVRGPGPGVRGSGCAKHTCSTTTTTQCESRPVLGLRSLPPKAPRQVA